MNGEEEYERAVAAYMLERGITDRSQAGPSWEHLCLAIWDNDFPPDEDS